MPTRRLHVTTPFSYSNQPPNPAFKRRSRHKDHRTLGKNNGVIAYADDLAVWCKDLDTVAKLTTHLENFAKISGLKCNKGKTEVIPVNANTQDKDYIINDLKLTTTDQTIVTGVQEDRQTAKEALENGLEQMKGRGLLILGRVLVTKSLGLSKLIYLGGIQGINPKERKKLDLTLAKFIWKSGRDRMNRTLAKKDTDLGGIKWTGTKEISPALNLKWLSKALDNNTIVGQMLHEQLKNIAGECLQIDRQIINRLTDNHLKDTLNDWNTFSEAKTERPELLDLNIYSSATLFRTA